MVSLDLVSFSLDWPLFRLLRLTFRRLLHKQAHNLNMKLERISKTKKAYQLFSDSKDEYWI